MTIGQRIAQKRKELGLSQEALGEELGRYLGEEAAANDVNVLLGPGLNIKRSPLCGRNFE